MKKRVIYITAVILSIVLFPPGNAIAKDKVRIGGDVVVDEGTEVKDAVAVGGSVRVNGKVIESVVAVGGSVFLGPNAMVGEDVVSVGGVIKQEQGAKIHGDIVELNIPGISAILPFFLEDTTSGWFWTFKITTFLGFLALAILIVAVLPKPFNLISNNVQQNMGKVILWGILGLVVLVPLTFFLLISVIGIPLIALEGFLVGIAFLIGYIAVAQLIGNKIVALLKGPAPSALWVTLMGLLSLWLISWVPFLGSLVKAVVIVLGFGGVLVSLLTFRNRVQVDNAM